MSHTLTALRLAAIAALNSHPTLRTMVAGRVYDSRLGEFDSREPVPTLTVTTEEVRGEAFDPQNGGAPFDDSANLVVEIAMNVLVDVAEDAPPAIGTPSTDAELESALNTIAWCAEQILTTGQPAPYADSTPEGRLLRAVIRRVNSRSIDRFKSDETSEKLAVHVLTFAVDLFGEEPPHPFDGPAGAFAKLSEPLRTVCEATPSGSSARATCEAIAAALPPVPTLHPFNVHAVGVIPDPLDEST